MTDAIDILGPDMYREDILGPPPGYRIVARGKIAGKRYYIVLHDDLQEVPTFYPSVTTVTGEVYATAPQLIQWYCSFPSYDMARERLALEADRGTVMHTIFAKYFKDEIPALESREYDEFLAGLIDSHTDLDSERYAALWKTWLTKALLSLIQWVRDYDVIPWCVELPMVSKKWKIAGQVDLICEMNRQKYSEKTPPGKRKRIVAMVDFKKGNLWPGNAGQLGYYLLIAKENLPILWEKHGGIRKAFNWSPKDWRIGGGQPTYTFHDHSKNIRQELLELDLKRFMLQQKKLPDHLDFMGTPRVSDGNDASEHVVVLPTEEYWAGKIGAWRASQAPIRRNEKEKPPKTKKVPAPKARKPKEGDRYQEVSGMRTTSWRIKNKTWEFLSTSGNWRRGSKADQKRIEQLFAAATEGG